MNLDNTYVSIIIPTYNRESMIEKSNKKYFKTELLAFQVVMMCGMRKN